MEYEKYGFTPYKQPSGQICISLLLRKQYSSLRYRQAFRLKLSSHCHNNDPLESGNDPSWVLPSHRM